MNALMTQVRRLRRDSLRLARIDTPFLPSSMGAKRWPASGGEVVR